MTTETRIKTKIVDADGHYLEPPYAIPDYIEPKYKDVAPRIVRNADGVDEWVGKHWSSYNQQMGAGNVSNFVFKRDSDSGHLLAAQEREEANKAPMIRNYADQDARIMGSEERVDILDEEGIDVSVLYPTLGLQWVSEPEYHMALNRALNDWLGDFVKADPRRLYGAANIVAIWDVEMACDEIRRCATEHGFPAAFLRSALPDAESRWWRDTYDPFWATCQDLDVAVGFHPFPGDVMYGSGRYFDYVGPTGAQMFIRTPFNHMVDSMNTLTAIIVGGTFERFPDLRVGILESSGGWLLTLLERLDNRFDHLGQIVPEMQMAPSDYFRRNCWISFDPEEAPLALTADILGADRIIWGSDYPHPDAFYPNFVEMLNENLAGMSTEDQDRIRGRNALDFYKLPEER